MEVSALKYHGGISLHGRSPLLRIQSDERLIAYLRRGNMAAFEVLVSRYESRLLSFCRHLLGSREDAEDVLQEVMTAAFNAILADDRPINVRPWLYRIARNRSLNHLRRIQAIGVDSMDMHYSENGASTADKVHEREEFRLLVGDIHELPETQKTALVLREMDALSYEQIAEAMETTVPSVKSLLVRARVSLAEAAEARLLSCDEVRIELGEVAEGLRRRPSPLVRRHLRACERCSAFRGQLRDTNKALAALMPIGPLVILKKLALAHLGHSAGAGSSATAAGSSAAGAGAGAAGAGAAAGGTALAGSGVAAGSGGFISAGLGAIATKAAAGLAAAAIVTAGAVEADHSTTRIHRHRTEFASVQHPSEPAQQAALTPLSSTPEPRSSQQPKKASATAASTAKPTTKVTAASKTSTAVAKTTATTPTSSTPTPAPTPVNLKTAPTGRDQTQQDPTVMAPTGGGIATTGPTPTSGIAGTDPTSAGPTTPTSTDAPPTDTPLPGAPPPPTGTPTTGTPTTGTPPPTTNPVTGPGTPPPGPPGTNPNPPPTTDPGTGTPPGSTAPDTAPPAEPGAAAAS